MLIGVWTCYVLIKQTNTYLRRRGRISEISKATSTQHPSLDNSLISKEITKATPNKRETQTISLRIRQISENYYQNSTVLGVTMSGSKRNPESVDIIDFTKIEFLDSDEECCKELTSIKTKVIGSAGNHDHGSSRVKLKNLVDYKWEVKHFPGHLIAVHMDGNHVAYVINVGAKGGMVRVVEAQTGLRALIKGMNGEVLDLQFAHIANDCILASIDMQSLFVHRIFKMDNSLNCSMMLIVEDPLKNYTPAYDKVSWCPFIDSGEDDEYSRLIVWSRSNIFQCFDVHAIVNEYGHRKIQADELKVGTLKFKDPKLTITWVALSPDGSTLGVGSLEGYIRFYQVYMYDQEPRCLHQWNPHNSKAISSFFFLDDLNKSQADTYWKFAITGANNNTEFKVWDCGNWGCLQTINICTQDEDQRLLRFIAEIDPTSSYLVISSLEMRACYVLQIVHNETFTHNVSDNLELHKLPVYIKSIAEFPLHSGILSFSIVEAATKSCKNGNDNYAGEELEMEDYEDDLNIADCVGLHMFIVQPKSMQECRIFYEPLSCNNYDNTTSRALESPTKSAAATELELEVAALKESLDILNVSGDACNNDNESSATTTTPATVRSTSTASKNELSETLSPHMSASNRSSALLELSNEKKPLSADQDVSSNVLNTILLLASVTGQNSTATKSDNLNLINLVNNKTIEDQEQKKLQMRKSLEKEKSFMAIDSHPERHVAEHVPSGSSSPSREVQEIMSLQQSYNNGNDTIDVQKILETDSTDTVINVNSVDWPKAPTISKVSSTHSEELQNAASLIAQAVQSNNTLPTHKIMTSEAGGKTIDLDDINNKLTQMMDLIKVQTLQINNLHNELQELKKMKTCDAKNMTEFSFKIEMQLSKLMEQYLRRYEVEHNKKLIAFMSGRDGQNRELRDSLMQILNQYVLTQLSGVASKVIIYEIQRQLVPLINGKIDQLQQQLQLDVTQKFNTFDLMIKENITQVCKNKTVIETFGKSVLAGVQNSLQTAFIESMSSTLIPAYEKASQNMFQQLHDAFALGIKEFMEQFEVNLQQLKPMNDNADQIIQTIYSLRKVFDETVMKQHQIVTEAMSETRKEVKNLEILMSRQISETMRHELRKCFEAQASTIRSQTNTPALVYDMRDSIRLLLQQGQINKAFHQALLADDLSLVEFTLKTADHNAVFNPQCCLEQKVLLSLIHQISADMTNHNEIKQNYLTEALLAIDPLDPITREHAPNVLQELFRHCQKFLVNFPKSPQCSNVRMLMKGVQAYIEKF